MNSKKDSKSVLPEEVKPLCATFLHKLNEILHEKLYALYIYGALVFPEKGPTGDIDFHVILTDTLAQKEKVALTSLHAELAKNYPPLGAELDGYYILLKDTKTLSPPPHQWIEGIADDAWALHCAHILAGMCVVLKGPLPETLYPTPPWNELDIALQKEMHYVENHLDMYPAYCVLNLCRLMYSYATHNVVISKRAAGTWAKEKYPEWKLLIDAAIRTNDHTETQDDETLLFKDVGIHLCT